MKRLIISLGVLVCFCLETGGAEKKVTPRLVEAKKLAPVMVMAAPPRGASQAQKSKPAASTQPSNSKPTTLASPPPIKKQTISINLRDVEISEVMDMLSRKERISILTGSEVKGKVSVNLYDVNVRKAIRIIANAAGFTAEYRDDMYFIVKRDEMGKYGASGNTVLKTFRIQYSKPDMMKENLKNYLSAYGKINTLPDRNMLVVEDMPVFMRRIEQLLRQLDREPKQVLIEAKILEIRLDNSETFGLDWSRVFKSAGGTGKFGVRGLDNPASAGLFFNFLNNNIDVALNLLETQNRVRTLSSPKLMVLENQEAKVIVGGREGFKVTTTINLVTTESIQFLDFGVILKVTPFVDNQRRIWIQVHPEVSTVEVKGGIPGKKSTEVETRLLLKDGQTGFIGGLIKNAMTENRSGVPVLKDIPGIRLLFSNKELISNNTEMIVLLTPHIVDQQEVSTHLQGAQSVENSEQALVQEPARINAAVTEAKRKDLHQPSSLHHLSPGERGRHEVAGEGAETVLKTSPPEYYGLPPHDGNSRD